MRFGVPGVGAGYVRHSTKEVYGFSLFHRQVELKRHPMRVGGGMARFGEVAELAESLAGEGSGL